MDYKTAKETLDELLKGKNHKLIHLNIKFILNEYPEKADKMMEELIIQGYYLFDIKDEYIEKYENEINWEILSKDYNFTSEQILKYKDNIDFLKLNHVSYYNLIEVIDKFPVDFLENLNWWKISIMDDLGIDFIRKYKSLLIWSIISANTIFTEEELIEFKDYISWTDAFFVQNISDNIKEKIDFDFNEYEEMNKKKNEKFIKKMNKRSKILKSGMNDISSKDYIVNVINEKFN